MINIRRYIQQQDSERWNQFVKNSANATFLHLREYMDYHADRFDDFSLIAENDGNIIALLPANISADGTLHSHSGLTYAGWLAPRRHFNTLTMMQIWDAFFRFCRSADIRALDYKPVPYIYHHIPRQEDIYTLFRLGALKEQCNISSTIYMPENPGFNTMKRRQLRRAEAENMIVSETKNFSLFWKILSECLHDRHDALPVHSLEEIQRLASLLPENIRLFTIGHNAESPLAGVVVYDCGNVAHCQYIASNEEGRQKNLLTLLFDRLINDIFASKTYFDLGTSNLEGGRVLNEGLLSQKSALGASGVVYERYSLLID